MAGGDYLLQEHMCYVSVSIEDTPGNFVPIAQSFDKFDGGDVKADGAEPYNAGGMVESEALAGVVKTDEIKCARAMRSARDVPLRKWLRARINHRARVGVQWLNPDKTPVVDGLETFNCKLSGTSQPTMDSSGQAVTMFELSFNVEGLPT